MTHIVSVTELVDFWDPMEHLSRLVTPAEVREAISQGRQDERPEVLLEHLHKVHTNYHAERIAYLVGIPAQDAITIDVGVPQLGFVPEDEIVVEDGNHRLAAAWYRGDNGIAVEFSGSVDRFHSLFPTAIEIRAVALTDGAGG